MKIRNLNQKLKIKTELKKIGKICLKNLSEEHYRKMGEIVINVIHILAQQITRGSLLITSIYREATKDPFSYLFINLTQEAQTEVKFLSHLLDRDHILIAYVEQPSRL